ncbi:hypothetical protein HDR60_03105 [bacterium]|nr:hypothetical protein [bacterium]
MNELALREDVQIDNDQIANISFTEATRKMMNEKFTVPYGGKRDGSVEESLDSIYEVAALNNKPVIQFIQDNPEYALLLAEMSYAKWTNVLTQVSLTGVINTDEGSVEVGKNQMKALELRVSQAKSELEFVTDLALTVSQSASKRDMLIRKMYISAILHRDTRAQMYLIDRIDGRAGETKVAELSYDNAYNIYMILHTLFKKQLDVINAGNGTVLVCCSRRAGKTHMLVATCLIECMRRPNTTCIYIGETMELTEGLIDSAVNEIVDKCHLQDKKGKRFNWRKMDNGSQILVRGLSNTKDPDQIRGHKAVIIVIDEFYHLKSDLLEYLQREVLQPMQMDYADGYKFICAGTPPQIKGTYGEMAWKSWEVPHFSWTWEDNPHPVDIESRRAYVEKVLEEKGLTWESSFARREYRGEWAYDDDLVLYPNYKVYNPEEGIPQWKISRVFFGIDYGCSDNDSVFGVAWSDDEGKGYQFFEVKFNRLDVNDYKISQLEYLKQQVMVAWEKALDIMLPGGPDSGYTVEDYKRANKQILWDADDNDQHVTQELGLYCKFDDELRAPLSMQIANAHKTDKKIMWDKIDELMRTGRLLFIKGSKICRECESTILLRGPNGEIFSEIDDKVYHPDLLPCMRYCMWNVIGF